LMHSLIVITKKYEKINCLSIKMTGCFFIDGSSIFCRESHLQNLFQKYGQVVRDEIKNKIKNKSQQSFKYQGYGFIAMETVEEAENAMNGLNGFMFGKLK
jgi:RNA recognition motif-containing protein